MTITPHFSVKQDDEKVIISITVPYVRISSAEVAVQGSEFSFYCSPYLLKLKLPHDLADDAEEKCQAVYDPNDNNGTFIAKLPKKIVGQYFPDLDLTTKLFPSIFETEKFSDKNFGIEVISSSENTDDKNDQKETIENQINNDLSVIPLKKINYYGFNRSYFGIFKDLKVLTSEMVEISDPELLTLEDRRKQRILLENQKFNAERYIDDYFNSDNDDIYITAMQFEPFWIKQWDIYKKLFKKRKEESKTIDLNPTTNNVKNEAFEQIGGFNNIEKDILKSLRNKEYLIQTESEDEFNLISNLIDILFAFCYDYRLINGEENVESAHNISYLSYNFSWFDAYNIENYCYNEIEQQSHVIGNVIKSCLRRSIIYPYIRYWKFSRKVLSDVAKILFLGKRCILKCLLQLKNTFEHSDVHYLLNKVFVNDYCQWIQSNDNIDETIENVAKLFNQEKNKIEQLQNNGKEYMGLNLIEIEKYAEGKIDNLLLEANGDEYEINKIPDFSDIPSDLLNFDDFLVNQTTNKDFAYLFVSHHQNKLDMLENAEKDSMINALTISMENDLKINSVESDKYKPKIEVLENEITKDSEENENSS